MADFTLQALNDEIDNDPTSQGYKEVGGEWKADQVIVDLINAQDLKIDRLNITANELQTTATYDAYNNLSIDEQEWFQILATIGSGGQSGTGIKVNADLKLQLSGRTLTSNGAAGTGFDNNSWWAPADDQDIAPAFLALIEISGSRAEVLWDEGATISPGQVGAAANL